MSTFAMPEPVALALAIAGLYGEALRAQERGDTAGAARCMEAFERLSLLNAERGAPQITEGLCATMRKAHELDLRRQG
jgi:hypothetical protein